MAMLTNLKYYEKEQVSILDVERVHQRCVSGFTSSGSTMVAHAFDFMANLNRDC
jgi:superfamily II RNA helicase